MDSLDALLKASGLLLPLLWKEGIDRIARKRSGKRIQYVIWHDGQSGLLNPRLRKLKALFSRRKNLVGDGSAEQLGKRTARIFLWNAGTEDFSSEDFFEGNPLFIDVIGGRVVSHDLVLRTDDLGQVSVGQMHRTSIHPVQPRSKQVVSLEFEHWPPSAGLVVEVRYECDIGKAGRLHLGGPVRSLRERVCLGTLWRIDLNRPADLRGQLTATKFITWLSGIAFLVVLALFLTHIRSWTVASSAYWLSLSVVVSLEWVFIVWNEKRIQLTKKVCRSLAYWLDTPSRA